MSALLDPHIGHHIIATIAVKNLLLGWDAEKRQPIWSMDAPAEIRRAILQFVEDHSDGQYDS